MAKLVYACALGAHGATHGGSSPLRPTMHVKFLGTSAGWPLPRLGCSCEICTSRDPKDKRTRTQVLIDGKILLDAGPETYRHLLKEDISRLQAILISHPHPDHILGLWDLPHIYGRAENGLGKITLYVTQPVLNNLKSLFTQTLGGPINVKVVKPKETFKIGNAQITYIPVIHGKTPAYAIKVKDGKIFTYITDFKSILPSSQKMIRHSHMLALDGSSLGKLGQTPTHISITDGITIGQNLKAKSVYFVHIGHKTGTHRHLDNFLRENAGPNFHPAFDGLEIDI